MQDKKSNEERFSEKGIKNTKQRNMVYNILENSNVPITAEQIYLELNKRDYGISLSTVYRILDVFIDKGLVVKIIASDKPKAYFELNEMEYSHHITCKGCNCLMSIDTCPLKSYESSLEKKTGFDITGHKLIIYGYCSECKKRNMVGE